MSRAKEAAFVVCIIIVSIFFMGFSHYSNEGESSTDNGTKPENQQQKIITPKERIDNILQVNRDLYPGFSVHKNYSDDSYIVSVSQNEAIETLPNFISQGKITVSKNFDPISDRPEITGLMLLYFAGIITRDLYNEPSTDKIKIIGYIDDSDDYGNPKQIKVFSFEFTRPLYDKINWDNFNTDKLQRVAKHFTYYE